MACVKYSALNRCQTCLGDPIETSRIESLHVSQDMVSLLTYFNIQICEGLPNAICSTCIRTFENIITFKHQCVVSQTFLQNQYQAYLRTNVVEDIKPNIEKNDLVNNVLPVEIKVDNIKEEIEDDCTAFTATNTTFTATDYSQVDTNYSSADGSTEKKRNNSSRVEVGKNKMTKTSKKNNQNSAVTATSLRHRKVANVRKRTFLDRMTPEEREVEKAKDNEFYHRKKVESQKKFTNDMFEGEKNMEAEKNTKEEVSNKAAYFRQREMANARKRKYLDRMTSEQREMKRAKDREYYHRKKVEMQKKSTNATNDIERKREMAKARKRKFLFRMTSEQREMKRANDREYYHRKKAERQKKSINDMSEKEKRQQRKLWRKNSQKYREKKRMSSKK